ncbi:hypothetical protein ACHAXH_002969 [Discostella pseudostelligera]
MNGSGHTDRSGNGGRRSFRRSPYAVLNLSHGSDSMHHPINRDKIRESYKRLSRLLHPDKRPAGKERDDAQELFIEIQHAYETLDNPVLRQAYDNFGYAAVEIIRHNRYAPYSLYSRLSKIHDEGKPNEALEVLHTVLEDIKQDQRRMKWLWNADVEVNMHTYSSPEGRIESVDVSSTNVSLSASVPVPPQIAPSPFPTQSGNDTNQYQQSAPPNRQRMQLSIGGQANLKNGMGSTQGTISANYQPVAHTSITSDIAIGRKIESSISSSTVLANGTGLSAKVSRQILFQRQKNDDGEGQLAFGFTSNRRLTMFHGRTVHAMFALGVGSDLAMHYGLLSLTTWGIASASSDDELKRPPPRLTAKLSIGTQFPFECSIDQSHLFNSPHRSGRASLAWSPIKGCKLKAMLSRELFRKCAHDQSKFASNLGIGVEHTGLFGFKWLIHYQRPEGLTLRIPIFVSSFLSPGYWNRALSISLFSFVIDEVIEESWGYSPSAENEASRVDKSISAKMSINEKERHWLHSIEAKRAAERQLCLIVPVAREKQLREELANGLVILKATYMAYPLPSDLCPNISLDVTQQLQFWVDNSRLCLPALSKSSLIGFYDLHHHAESTVQALPRWKCMINGWLSRIGFRGMTHHYQCQTDQEREGSAAVTLSVRYKHNGGVYEITIRDDDALELPSSGALHLGPSKVVS